VRARRRTARESKCVCARKSMDGELAGSCVSVRQARTSLSAMGRTCPSFLSAARLLKLLPEKKLPALLSAPRLRPAMEAADWTERATAEVPEATEASSARMSASSMRNDTRAWRSSGSAESLHLPELNCAELVGVTRTELRLRVVKERADAAGAVSALLLKTREAYDAMLMSGRDSWCKMLSSS
jgi:hypothetical protein